MRKKPKPATAARHPVRYLTPAQAKAAHQRRHLAALKAAATRRKHAAAARVPPGGGGYQLPAAKKKPAKRKLAAPGESCVLDACYAIAGWRPDLDTDDGLFIPDALEVLGILGLITGLAPADLDSDLSRPGLVLGVDLPGPHAVLTTPGGWWSWGELYDPADFPLAVIEEAWQVTW